jgi:hypothetical protein
MKSSEAIHLAENQNSIRPTPLMVIYEQIKLAAQSGQRAINLYRYIGGDAESPEVEVKICDYTQRELDILREDGFLVVDFPITETRGLIPFSRTKIVNIFHIVKW